MRVAGICIHNISIHTYISLFCQMRSPEAIIPSRHEQTQYLILFLIPFSNKKDRMNEWMNENRRISRAEESHLVLADTLSLRKWRMTPSPSAYTAHSFLLPEGTGCEEGEV